MESLKDFLDQFLQAVIDALPRFLDWVISRLPGSPGLHTASHSSARSMSRRRSTATPQFSQRSRIRCSSSSATGSPTLVVPAGGKAIQP